VHKYYLLILAIIGLIIATITCNKNPIGTNANEIIGEWQLKSLIEKTYIDSNFNIINDGIIKDSIDLSFLQSSILFKSETMDSSSIGTSFIFYSFIANYKLISDTIVFYLDTIGTAFNSTYLYKLKDDSLSLTYLFGDTLNISDLRPNLNGKYSKKH
jgi:hypothetical protein